MVEATEEQATGHRPQAAEDRGPRTQDRGPRTEDPGPRTEDEGSAEEADPSAELRAERDRYLELAKRTQADFENYRKRAAKDAAAAGERAKGGLVRELLPVLDNLERALATANGEGANVDSVVEGVRLVHADLVGVLQRTGVKAFDPKGEPFDPTVHEALSTRPAEDGDHAGVVVDVVEKGYKLNDTVLRPARVIVSQ